MSREGLLMEIFERLFKAFGPQHWWPGDTPFEVMVGAVLTQNTNWANVEKAISNLKREGLMDPGSLGAVSLERLSQLIRPAGYYNIKARRLKNLLDLVNNGFSGDLNALFSLDTPRLRELLLGVKGIGPETADSIILYAARKPVFVVDAYTFRVMERHGLVSGPCSYDELQEIFLRNLKEDTDLFSEYHALIVRLCKTYCLRSPKCQKCPLEDLLPQRR